MSILYSKNAGSRNGQFNSVYSMSLSQTCDVLRSGYTMREIPSVFAFYRFLRDFGSRTVSCRSPLVQMLASDLAALQVCTMHSVRVLM